MHSRLKFVGQSSTQKACTMTIWHHPKQTAPETTELIEAEIAYSANLGLKDRSLIRYHYLLGQVAIR